MPLRLLKGIHHFKNNQYPEKLDLFRALSTGQSPDVIFITCSDSRIIPSLLTHSDIGQLFVIRNAGNIVAPASPHPSGEAATIEFGLQTLQVNEIIVCGHSHCGAMKGLLTPDLAKTLPSTAAWLNHSKPALDHLHERHPELEKDSSSELVRLTQDNVLLQIEHLKTHPTVASRLNAGTLKIHGWYYEFEKGEICIYNQEKNQFLSFEDTVELVSKSHLHKAVEQEALNYLSQLAQSKDEKKFAMLHANFSKLKQNVAFIWEHIKDLVTLKLMQEIGELYQDKENSLNPKFHQLVNSGATHQLQCLDTISNTLKKSPFYNPSPQRNRLFSAPLKAPLEDEKNTTLATTNH